MSQSGNEDKRPLESPTEAIAQKIIHGNQKNEELLSLARIYKVPEDLRMVNESAYTPRLIAIGPLHRDDSRLQTPMHHIKTNYSYNLLSRLTEGIEDENKRVEKKGELLMECVEKMKDKGCIDMAKKYYAADITLNDDQMSEMMLVDGCFILELLYASHRVKEYYSKAADQRTTNVGNSKASNSDLQPTSGGEEGISGGGEQQPRADTILGRSTDPIFDNMLIAKIVKQDLILLENQIPFFVLEHLFQLTLDKIIPEAEPELDQITGLSLPKLSLVEYVLSYFKDIIMTPQGKNTTKMTKTSSGDSVLWLNRMTSFCFTKEIELEKQLPEKTYVDYYHILHLLHCNCLSGDHQVEKNMMEPPSGTKFTDFRLSASYLDYAGVNFVAKETTSMFKIKFTESRGMSWWFERAKYEIPSLPVNDRTEAFLRNLIALEQCCPGVSQHCFTSYAIFFAMLINSEKDVQVLRKAGVVHNYLGTDEDVCDLFDKLCKEVVIGGQFYFSNVCQEAFHYSKRFWWPKLLAYLKRTYFDSPWGFIAFSLAFIAFGMSVTQFIKGFLK